MPFDKKRLKEIQKYLPAMKHLINRSIKIETKNISDVVDQKKKLTNQSITPENLSLDEDLWDSSDQFIDSYNDSDSDSDSDYLQ